MLGSGRHGSERGSRSESGTVSCSAWRGGIGFHGPQSQVHHMCCLHGGSATIAATPHTRMIAAEVRAWAFDLDRLAAPQLPALRVGGSIDPYRLHKGGRRQRMSPETGSSISSPYHSAISELVTASAADRPYVVGLTCGASFSSSPASPNTWRACVSKTKNAGLLERGPSP